MAVLTACFSSGLAGVYFEMLVKTGAQTSIVIRNLQLGKYKKMLTLAAIIKICSKAYLYFIENTKFSAGIFSLVFASMAVMYNDANEVLENGFFQGYDGVVILIVLIQVRIPIYRCIFLMRIIQLMCLGLLHTP